MPAIVHNSNTFPNKVDMDNSSSYEEVEGNNRKSIAHNNDCSNLHIVDTPLTFHYLLLILLMILLFMIFLFSSIFLLLLVQFLEVILFCLLFLLFHFGIIYGIPWFWYRFLIFHFYLFLCLAILQPNPSFRIHSQSIFSFPCKPYSPHNNIYS